jgi:hypothetical protein
MKKLVADVGGQDEGLAFIGSTDTRDLLEKREAASGNGFLWADGKAASLRAYATAVMPAAPLLCGEWSRCTVALWGIQLLADPFTEFKTGKVQFRVSLLDDTGVSQPDAFCKSESIT